MKITAKKSLGQNFLKSKTALFKLLEAGAVGPDDTVLEVGPGEGVLTEKLLAVAKKVVAVEKDDRLIPILEEKFAAAIGAGKLCLIHDDILNFSPAAAGLSAGKYKLIANIPYYITGQLLRLFLESSQPPERMVVMVQKEIAERIVATDGKESLLSLSVKAFGYPKKIMTVGRENFSPAPNVDSAILLIADISPDFFQKNKLTTEKFFTHLHAGFAHKRKMLLPNLRAAFPESDWEKIFNVKNIPLKVRAEDLNLETWGRIISD